MNCKHNLPANICMICETTTAGWPSNVTGSDEISKAMRYVARLDPEAPYDGPDSNRKQPTWCIGCKDHSGRLTAIDDTFISWKCYDCCLTWLTVRTNDETVGNCIAAHIIAISGRKVA